MGEFVFLEVHESFMVTPCCDLESADVYTTWTIKGNDEVRNMRREAYVPYEAGGVQNPE